MSKSYEDQQPWTFLVEDNYGGKRYIVTIIGSYLTAANSVKAFLSAKTGIPWTRLDVINQAQVTEIVVLETAVTVTHKSTMLSSEEKP